MKDRLIKESKVVRFFTFTVLSCLLIFFATRTFGLHTLVLFDGYAEPLIVLFVLSIHVIFGPKKSLPEDVNK